MLALPFQLHIYAVPCVLRNKRLSASLSMEKKMATKQSQQHHHHASAAAPAPLPGTKYRLPSQLVALIHGEAQALQDEGTLLRTREPLGSTFARI
jgi:hypothetical protein